MAAGRNAATVPDYDLTTLDGLLGAVAAYEREQVGEFTGTYCARCGGLRRMRLLARDDRCANLGPGHLKRTRHLLEQIPSDRDPLLPSACPHERRKPRGYRASLGSGSDGTRTRDLRRDRRNSGLGAPGRKGRDAAWLVGFVAFYVVAADSR